MVYRYGVLGSVEAWAEGTGEPVWVERPRHRALLGLLVLNAGQVLSPDYIADALWGGAAPQTSRSQIHASISALRRVLGETVLLTRGAGYQLAAESGVVDLREFERAVGVARRERDPAVRAAGLRAALTIWRGPAFDGVQASYAEAVRVGLDEAQLTVLEERYEAELQAGRHAEVVPALLMLVRNQPYRERLRMQLMLAYYRVGRPAEAMAAYREGQALLADCHGLDPSPAIVELSQGILRGDRALAAPVGSVESAEEAAVAASTLGLSLARLGRWPATHTA